MAVSMTLQERRHSRQNRNPQARVFPISRARGSSVRCGAEEIVNAAEVRDVAGVPMSTGLNSTRIKVSGTNSTGVRC